MVPNNRNIQILNKIFWLGIFGVAIHTLGLYGYIKIYTVLPLIIFLLYQMRPFRFHVPVLKKSEKILCGLVVCQLLVYSLGLFVPETAFDAIWYHFPEARTYAVVGKIIPLPELPYSTMPKLGEMYFTAGFLIAGQFGAKLVSFMFTGIFLYLTFTLARRYLSPIMSLLVVAAINSMFVIAWQSSSGYVDSISAVFQLASLIAILTSSVPLAAVFAGFALSVKMQSVVHLFAILPIIYLQHKTLKKRLIHCSLFIGIAILVASPWYISNFRATGSAIYPLNQAIKQADQLNHAGGFNTKKEWIIHQISHIYNLPIYLSVHPDLQLTPIILLLLPLLIFNRKSIAVFNPELTEGEDGLLIFLYVIFYLLIWWFIPPPEHRYALAAIPPLLIVLFATLNRMYRPAIAFSLIFIILNLSIRLYVSRRYIPVILGLQAPADYIKSQTTDFNRDILEKFYAKSTR